MLGQVRVCPQCSATVSEQDRFCASCGHLLDGTAQRATSEDDPYIGRLVAGSYLVQELIGVGGMGRVYRGVQKALGRTVAIKVIHPHLLSDEQTVARFYNEARAASRLNHPDSVSVIDFGRTDDGILYLVMEHLAGKDLATVISEEGPLAFKRVTRVLRHILSALGEAHALDVIHRDLKPENVLLMPSRRGDESVKVLDFGLATITGPGNSSITTPGLVCGTPDYMSPEQGRGDVLDGRSDLYSVGVVLFELLTDRLPFIDDTPTKVVLRHINDPVPDPRELSPHRAIPDNLAAIAMRALAKEPEQRFQSADEMLDAVRRAEAELESAPVDVICPTCSSKNPRTVRFCGECGARIGSPSIGSAAVRSIPPPPLVGLRDVFVGRDKEARALIDRRGVVQERSVWITVTGEIGAGKTRLVEFVSDKLREARDRPIWLTPHVSGAPVPYSPVKELIAALLGVPKHHDEALLSNVAWANEVERQGIREIVTGLPRTSRKPRRIAAVAQTILGALRYSLGLSGNRAIVMVLDDFDRFDLLSIAALNTAAAKFPPRVMALATATEVPEGTQGEVVNLAGITIQDADTWLGKSDWRPTNLLASQKVLPLFVEQGRYHGNWFNAAGEPQSLADVIEQRLARLDMPARKLLQAIAVLGGKASESELLALGTNLPKATEALLEEDLVVKDEEDIEVSHPLIRSVVESSMPAEARRELHQKALAIRPPETHATEVRAEHAWRSGEAFWGLVLLEQMGEEAARRGDWASAVLAQRRGLELARRELFESGDRSLGRAELNFSRKLAQALLASGELAGAEGILREVLELSGPHSTDRSQMLVLLSVVLRLRNKLRDAARLIGQALELARRIGDVQSEVRAHLNMSQLRFLEEDLPASLQSLTQAIERMRTMGNGLAQADLWADAAQAAEIAGHVTLVSDCAEGILNALTEVETTSRSQRPFPLEDALRAEAFGWLARYHRDTTTGQDAVRQEAERLSIAIGDTTAWVLQNPPPANVA